MLRPRLVTSHSTEPPHGGDGGGGDDAYGGDERWATPRHWVTLHPSVQPCWGRLQVKPPSPGSARGPAPPALRRIAPQSTGKQYASYPSPSRFLDGDFASRLTFTQAIAIPLRQILENVNKSTGFLISADRSMLQLVGLTPALRCQPRFALVLRRAARSFQYKPNNSLKARTITRKLLPLCSPANLGR